MSDDMETGAISPAGRFARMEASLERIEAKLDAKADLAVHQALALRVEAIEATGSPDAREALAIAKKVESHLQDMETGRSMSPQGMEYLKRFTEMESTIEDLKRRDAIRDAQQETRSSAVREISDARYNSLRTVVAIVAIAQSVILVGVTMLTLLHVI